MIVTTPEKWDVVTRKGTGDVGLSQLVRLLIIDEVHLLHEDRGAVIESLVARTLRQVSLVECVSVSVCLSVCMCVCLCVCLCLCVRVRVCNNSALNTFILSTNDTII